MAPEVLEGAQRLLEEQSPIIYAEGDRAAIARALPPGYRWFGQYARTPTHGFIRDRRPMRLSAAIMAHPTRETEVTELQAALDRPVPVAWDPNPTPSPDPARRWVTGRQAWDLHDPEADCSSRRRRRLPDSWPASNMHSPNRPRGPGLGLLRGWPA